MEIEWLYMNTFQMALLEIVSQVTWIEQAEYDKDHIHELYQLLIGSGHGLGAKRWFTTLQRHCESLLTLLSLELAQVSTGLSASVAIEFVRLGKRMIHYYNSSITGCSVRKWDIVHVENNQRQNMRFLSRKNVNQPGEQTGIVLSATTSLRLPVNHQILFEILSNRHFRHVWDILTCNSTVEK